VNQYGVWVSTDSTSGGPVSLFVRIPGLNPRLTGIFFQTWNVEDGDRGEQGDEVHQRQGGQRRYEAQLQDYFKGTDRVHQRIRLNNFKSGKIIFWEVSLLKCTVFLGQLNQTVKSNSDYLTPDTQGRDFSFEKWTKKIMSFRVFKAELFYVGITIKFGLYNTTGREGRQ